MLEPHQINTLLELIQRQTLFFAGATLGPDLLSDQEKELLKQHGVDYNKIYDAGKDIIGLNFHLGLLSDILSQTQTQALTYEQLYKYIQSGQHIPLNARERATVANIRMQSMADIRSAAGRIFKDVNNVVSNQLSSARSNQEEFLREQVADRTASRQSRKQIVREIAKLTGDWNRDFRKSVQYISHTALNEGRAAMIHRRAGDNGKARVYFQVQDTACDQCVKAYLTNGRGSAPKVFTLKELEANGSNIGRKQKDWLPTVTPLHVNCRCLLTEFVENESKRSDRPKVRIEFNGQEYFV